MIDGEDDLDFDPTDRAKGAPTRTTPTRDRSIPSDDTAEALSLRERRRRERQLRERSREPSPEPPSPASPSTEAPSLPTAEEQRRRRRQMPAPPAPVEEEPQSQGAPLLKEPSKRRPPPAPEPPDPLQMEESASGTGKDKDKGSNGNGNGNGAAPPLSSASRRRIEQITSRAGDGNRPSDKAPPRSGKEAESSRKTGSKSGSARSNSSSSKASPPAARESRASGKRGSDAAKARATVPAEQKGLLARNLGKAFKKRPVLRDVSVTVRRSEAVGLLGPNGAGKTTCFYIITGLLAPDQGNIFLDGQDLTDLPMYRRARLGIGYLPQEASIFRGLTVEGNLRAVLEVVEKDRKVREDRLEELLAEFSVTHLRRTPAVALSGGERRRVEIARALASKPHFILLDEPLAGIDPIAVGDIRDLVRHLKDRGIGVLITDHNVRETLDIVDRAYIIHEGTVLMEGSPEEIVANDNVRRVYLGDTFSL